MPRTSRPVATTMPVAAALRLVVPAACTGLVLATLFILRTRETSSGERSGSRSRFAADIRFAPTILAATAPIASGSAPAPSTPSTSSSTRDPGAKFPNGSETTGSPRGSDDARPSRLPLELVLSTGTRLRVTDVVGTPDGVAARLRLAHVEYDTSADASSAPSAAEIPIRLPWSAVDALGPPAGQRIVAFGESARAAGTARERPADDPVGSSRAGVWRAVRPLPAGEVRISLRANVVRTEPDQDAPRAGVSPYRVRYEFAELATRDAIDAPHAESDRAARPAIALLVERDADGTWRTREAPELRAARQALGPRLDGRELILEWRAERWSLRLDELVLAWGVPDGRGLVACLDESARSGRPEGRGVAESPLATWAILEPSGNSTPSPRTDPRQDSVQLVDGDELFGELASVTAEGVDLVAAGTRLRIDWPRIRALRPVRRIVASPALRGTWANIDVGAEPIAPTSPRALLEGVVERGADGAWLLEHPWLGRVPLSRAAIERRSTGFVGTRIVLVDHAVHLGARRRDDFRCALPFGTDAAGEFELGALPLGRVRLVLHVADVAPSGPAAPPGTPDLADLRTGFGMTRLLVNGGESGDANSQLRFERSPFGPQRIVLPIDAKLLRTGRNAWSLHQTPGRTARDAFDDCEIGPVVLEFVEFESPESK